MKVTIIPIDNAVYKNGYSYSGIDLTFIPANVHALQWKDNAGWIEFVVDSNGTKPQNEPITELPDWANQALVKWQESEDARLVEEAAQAAAIEAARLAAQQQAAQQGTTP